MEEIEISLWRESLRGMDPNGPLGGELQVPLGRCNVIDYSNPWLKSTVIILGLNGEYSFLLRWVTVGSRVTSTRTRLVRLSETPSNLLWQDRLGNLDVRGETTVTQLSFYGTAEPVPGPTVWLVTL